MVYMQNRLFGTSFSSKASPLNTPNSTIYTLHTGHSIPYTLHYVHFAFYALHSTLRTLHSTLHTAPNSHFTLSTPDSTLHTLHTTFPPTLHRLYVYTSHFTLCTPPQSTLHNLYWYCNTGRTLRLLHVLVLAHAASNDPSRFAIFCRSSLAASLIAAIAQHCLSSV